MKLMKLKHRDWLVFAALSAIFFAIQATHFTYSVSDENTYIYMAKSVVEGQLPYRDFFLAHPPLHILFLAAVYSVFGFNVFVIKATAPLMIMVAAAFIFKAVKKHASGNTAIVAAALLYFSYDLMRFTTFATWVTMATMLITISAYLALEKRHSLGGVAAAAASMTGLLAVVAALATAIYLFATDRKGFFKFAAAFISILAVANLVLILLLNDAYTTPVYKYHLMKPSEGGAGKGELFWHLIKLNPLIIAATAMFLFSRKRMRHIFLLPAAIIAAYLLAFVFLLNKIFGYYFLLIMPFLAIMGSRGITGFISRVDEDRKKQAIIFAVAIIITSAAISSHYYWKNDFQDFREAGQIAGYIKQNSSQNQLIFGDDSITPLIAILSDRKIALNMTDSNSLRWRSGLLDINDTIRQLKEHNVKFVIERRLNDGTGSFIYGPAYIDEFKEYMKRDCKPMQVFRTPWGRYYKEYYVFDCIAA